MGRRKVEIKRIQDKNCRQVAFCKRRKGLLKKAKEISILCDVDVAVVIISNRGRLHEFSSNNSLSGMLQRYESHVEAEKEINAEIQVAEHSKYSGFTTMGELLQTTERYRSYSSLLFLKAYTTYLLSQFDRQLEETNADGLTVTDLIHLENELQTALIQVRSRKVFLLPSVPPPYRNCINQNSGNLGSATSYTSYFCSVFYKNSHFFFKIMFDFSIIIWLSISTSE
uniref:MADS-box protein 15 n=2 Tax=Solanum tuberosum TaxID=4113 RepID=M1BI82_SOLTU